MDTNTEIATHEYQVWMHGPSGETYGIRLRPYVPAEARGVTPGGSEDQRYEASLIDGVCGPLFAGTGHGAVTEEAISDLNFSREDVEWVQRLSAEFRRVDPTASNECLLCHLTHSEA